ncbi:C45 family autoproteolytic acyltransferase/hydolase [Domibacillus epiphyticus]|uniref:Acyl-CoA--6-aminopenicillanic acid acyl-transferase n=1 Tax=Domibacillus epiphyticus TaxID=1714355 RepID=A0A1V2A9Q4_9BACI|nr:C45 family peptidase [Domibacillus epiphyticus]OMP67572.1 acyl-CoA--6-aminopenicillanic acid acyl-transferase [Domibacillus epiphyticus]
MQRFYVNVIQGRGSYYDLGVLAGEKLKVTPLFHIHQKRRKKSIRSYSIDFQRVKRYFNDFAPVMWEEFEGMAEALGWTLYDVIHEYSGFQLDDVNSGCSAMMQNGLFARNYDFHPKTYEGRLLLWQPDHGYASIGISGRMVGRIDGMNEKGLVIGFHFVNRRRAEEGFTCSMIARLILDSCATTEEAIELLSAVPHRHSFNYSLYDASLQSAVVEASPRGVHVHRNTFVCTNHFLSDQLAGENRYHTAESKERLAALESYSRKPHSAGEAYTLFNDPSFGVFKKKYSSWSGTLHTTVYEPATLRVLVGIGENARPVPIDFKRWKNGERFPITRIFGKIDSSEMFVHM